MISMLVEILLYILYVSLDCYEFWQMLLDVFCEEFRSNHLWINSVFPESHCQRMLRSEALDQGPWEPYLEGSRDGQGQSSEIPGENDE